MSADGDAGKVASSIFAELAAEDDKNQQLKKNAIVSFWKKRPEFDNFQCYNIIQVDRRLFVHPQTDGVDVKILLHKGQANEIFYFTRDYSGSSEKIVFNELNTEDCVKE